MSRKTTPASAALALSVGWWLQLRGRGCGHHHASVLRWRCESFEAAGRKLLGRNGMTAACHCSMPFALLPCLPGCLPARVPARRPDITIHQPNTLLAPPCTPPSLHAAGVGPRIQHRPGALASPAARSGTHPGHAGCRRLLQRQVGRVGVVGWDGKRLEPVFMCVRGWRGVHGGAGWLWVGGLPGVCLGGLVRVWLWSQPGSCLTP